MNLERLSQTAWTLAYRVYTQIAVCVLYLKILLTGLYWQLFVFPTGKTMRQAVEKMLRKSPTMIPLL